MESLAPARVGVRDPLRSRRGHGDDLDPETGHEFGNLASNPTSICDDESLC